MRWRSTLLLTAAVAAAGCSASDDDVTKTSAEPTPTTTVEASDPGGETTSTEPAAPAEPSSEIDVDAFDPGPFAWEPFNDAVDVATLEVPVDWADPDGPRFELFVARYNAQDQENKIGSLLVNPGGPGSEGTFLALSASRIYDQEILRNFDIIAWDPRGTGESDPPIDCIDDYDPYFTAIDSTPEDETERQELIDASRAFAEACVEHNEYLEYVGTNNSARDMDAIRRALGEDTISYFGFSYGSELGAAWATLFPDTVRAAVLDGAADPDADELESSLQQLAGFEASLETFLAQCSADPECAFHNGGDAEGAFDVLMASLDEDPIPPGDPSRPPVNRDVATTAVIEAMYSDVRWPALAESLAAAQAGDGAGLMALHDSYYQRLPDGTYDNFLEAFPVISCADNPQRRTVEEIDADSPRYTEVAPRLVPEGSLGGYTCTFMPPAVDPRVDITGAGAGTILVIGTTGDPSTPLDSTTRMANALEDSRLLIVEAEQHTGYGVNRCVVDAVNRYLVDLEPPEDGLRCG
ncbi:MAG: alpha/beta hydrolase [Acidimicrobiia bacterium]